jgi:alkylated DNA repair dioxygenase AlkB
MIDGLSYLNVFTEEEQSEILEELDDLPWLNDLKRRVQHYGYKYDYTAKRIDPSMHVGELPEFATKIGQQLIDLGVMEIMPDQLIVNEYMPGQGINPHVDCVPCFTGKIVTVSLGWAYEIEFVKYGEKHKLLLETGSVMSISGEARYHWTHGIRARKKDGKVERQRRVSLTFRNVILAEEL